MLASPVSGQVVEVRPPGERRGPSPAVLRRLEEQAGSPDLDRGWIARTTEAIRASEPLTGVMPVVVVLSLFADSPEPHVSSQQIQAALFEGPSPYGTVSDYYAEVSGGRFGVSGETTAWYRSSLTMAEVVGTEYGLGEDARTGAYLFEAVAAADGEVDFSRFDNDGPDGIPDSGDDDGVVDAVAFQYLEVSASCGGPSIWPHRSRLEYWNEGQPYLTGDMGANGSPIVVSDYTVQGATDCAGVDVQKASTVAHELGHVLGLPDLYDASRGLTPEMRRWVVGCWSLMAAGSWGCGTADRLSWVRPTHLGPWEKELLGWLSEVVVAEPALDLTYTLEPVQTSGRVLKVLLDPNAPDGQGEYLLLEYRARRGFDADLPAGGVMVYRVDPKVSGNRPCDTCPQLYRVSVLEADGNDGLRRTMEEGGNRGEAGDAWGLGAEGRLTNSTDPSTRLHSGAQSPVTLYSIVVEDGSARINLSARAVPAGSLLQSFLGSDATPLTAVEEDYLDSHGNRNGRYDVGDLRAYLRR
jgi:M6 family metalloprotease-like protein